VNFLWSGLNDDWNSFYLTLLSFRKKHPDKWPQAKDSYLGLKIGHWCVAQRIKNKSNKLQQLKKKKLNAINFKWKYFEDLTGLRFGRLRVVSLSGNTTNDQKKIWTCICDCGKESKSTSFRLKSGKHKSCGCLLVSAF
jgi:hypothetical protein